MAKFRPLRLPKGTDPDLARALTAQFGQIYDVVSRLEQRAGDIRVATTTYQPVAGETKRVSPPPEGMGLVLPPPGPENRGQDIAIFIEKPEGELRVFVSPNGTAQATVNGEEVAIFTEEGLVVFRSNGATRWNTLTQLPTTSTGGSALDAEYVLGAAHASLPNGRVATDSTEIDAELTVANVISWALRTASVVFAKLQNITGPTLLGLQTGTGPIEQLTGGEAGHLIKKAVDITVAIAADQNNFSPANFATCDTLKIDTAGGSYAITGFDSTVWPELEGTEFVVWLQSTGSLSYPNLSGLSLAGNTIRTPSSPLVQRQNEAISFRYVDGFWQAHPHARGLTGQEIGNRFRRGNSVAVTVSGTNHNWTHASLRTTDTFELTLTGATTITGIDSSVFAVDGETSAGRELIWHNVDSTDTLSLPTNTGSLSGNCFHSRAPNRTVNVRPGQSVYIRKEGNFWVPRLFEGPLLTNQVLLNDTTGTADPRGLSMGASTILARLASGNIIAATITQILDLIGSTRGSLTYRGAAAWSLLTPGTSGLPVVSQGAGADPIYARLALAALPQIANAGRVWGLQIDGSAPGNAVELTGAEQGENIRINNIVTDSVSSGTLTNYTSVANTTNHLVFTNTTVTLHSIAVPAQEGQFLTIQHTGTGSTTIVNNSTTEGTSTRRIRVGNMADNATLVLVANCCESFIYFNGRWRRLSTEILDDQATNAKLANMAESTIKLRAAGAGTGDPTDGTVQQVLAMLGTARAGNLLVHNGVSWMLVDEILDEEFWTNDGGSGGSDFGAWYWLQPGGVTMTPFSTSAGTYLRLPGHPGVVEQLAGPTGTSVAMAEGSSDASGDRGEILGEDIAFFRVVVRVVNPDGVANAFADARFGIGLTDGDQTASEFQGNTPNMGGDGVALFKSSASADWLMRRENGGTGSAAGGGFAAVEDEWIEVVAIQTSAGAWSWYVNGVFNDDFTGGPTGVGLVPCIWCDNEHATEDRYWQIDKFQVGLRFTNPRYD
jgi:hypothetical protein